jgi:PhoPQ-activated pathogenicity-related protein
MMAEWTNNYYPSLPGEKYLNIIPRTDHTLISGLLPLIQTECWFIRHIIYRNQSISIP